MLRYMLAKKSRAVLSATPKCYAHWGQNDLKDRLHPFLRHNPPLPSGVLQADCLAAAGP
jgi:hypothetical protein